MTPQASDQIHLQSTSGRKWSLSPVRPLSPSVQLTRNTTSTFAVKTLTLRSEDQINAAVAEANIWRRACAADSTNIVQLHDVAVDAPHVYYIMEYCPGGDLSVVRNERSALRSLSAVAAGLEVVLSRCEQPAHANLSSTHVLLDASGTPKLGGWGFSRARRLSNCLSNPKRRLTERDDVRALAAVLYEMLYGRRFDVDNLKLPETPRVSRLTADLLRNVLYVKLKDVPDLPVFRYDIAAARSLVPACTSALEPIINRRREEILDIDLDSKRGLESTPPPRIEVEKQREPHQQPPSTPSVEQHQLPDVVATSVQAKIITQPHVRGESHPPTGIDISSDSGIDDAVRRITKGDVESINADELDYLIESCTQIVDLPDKIFKVLFRLPISKNPIVAFKAITVIHRLVAAGPANLTALAITNDGFLNWIESSWSRDRMQNKIGKIHMYSYCFSAGEVSWYTAVLRNRIEIHGRFAQVFSTHWVPRPDGLPTITATRRDAFRLILGIAEKSSSILRKVVTAKDPAAHVKHSAVPVLVEEVWKAYHAICWLYVTAEDKLKPDLYPELELAHSATKSAMEAVKAVPSIAENCSPNTLLDLPLEVPREFDNDALIKALKKKKRKKKKIPARDSNDKSSRAPGPVVCEEQLHEKEEEKSQKSETNEEPSQEPAHRESKQKRRKEAKGRRDKEPENLEKGREVNSDLSRSRADEDGSFRQRETASHSSRPSAELNGLQKLSLSVRRGISRGPPERGYMSSISRYSAVEETDQTDPGASEVLSTSTSMPSRRRSGQKPKRSDDEEESSDSGDDNNARVQTQNGSVRTMREPKEKKKRVKQKKIEYSETDSDSEEDRPVRSKSDTQKKKKKKKKKQAKKPDSSESGSSNEEPAEEVLRRARKKGPKPKHVDEKSIPFDKEHPTKRRAKKKAVEEEYTGGSKEALAAAAKGRKTPSMNPKFEIAPYEVNFGPQIGSGGFGVVYKAKFRNETVAVKKIHGHALSNAASVGEFQAEVAVLCTLSHPNILRFVGACTKPPNLMIITEFMARGTLFDLLHQTNTRVTWPMRKKVALDTCKGMRYLHDSQLLHRDLKSSNLMLDKDFNCKVGDFGLTRISKGSTAVQMTGQCGTFQYMAVEVLANKPYSEKADVFSFGILLWEMVARKLPYFGMQPMQVGIAVLQQGLRPTIPPKCPEPLAKLMRACWDSDPNRRPSFAQLIHALESMPE